MDYTKLSDVELLTVCIYGEASGEPPIGKLAVAHVVLNRAASPSWWGHTLKEVLLKPSQFSCFNPADPNARRIESMIDLGYYDRACAHIAALALGGHTLDPTGSATHYCTLDCKPAWRSKMTETIRIGGHVFFVEA
jgi:spore germination cell wall hydrolase CwlJ-like protein